MHPIVIVHGAFGGGWEWTPVADLLRAEGLRVFTPTLSGLGDRAHVDARSVGLGTHVADIVAVLEMEALEDVLLCAASYAGVPVTSAVPQVTNRIAGVVYLDALVPRDGEAAADLLPGWFAASLREGIRTDGAAYRVPVPASVLPPVGSAPEDVRRSYIARLLPQPVRTFLDPAEVVPTTLVTTFVRSTRSNLGQGAEDPIAAMAQRAHDAGWDCREIAATHDLHLSNPDAVVALLRELAG
jgi:pimeloyl-ACP methyl ester carboxylesterase